MVKIKLCSLLLQAKVSQNAKLVRKLIEDIPPAVKRIMNEKEINAFGFIPPTVKRELQVMNEFKNSLNFGLPVINLVKAKTVVTVAQKP